MSQAGKVAQAPAVDADVPGGEALLDDIAECDRVLMAPKFSVWEYENPYLRPEHEVDLSFIAIPSDQGELLFKAGL